VTSVCLAFPAIDALADGYEVSFIEDAAADSYRDLHDTAVLRLAHAGAVPRTTIAMISEWFRDWKSPLADPARKIFVPYLGQMAALRRVPEYHEPRGVAVKEHA